MNEKINDTSVFHDLDAYNPAQHRVITHQGAEGTTTGGMDNLVTREGGSDAAAQEAEGFGGRNLL